MVTLHQLRYFMITAKLKSFSKASEILFLSQPALSKQITSLEKSLQFILFERSSKGIKLTDKGEQFFSRVQPIIQQLDLILEDVVVPKEIRFGVLSSVLTYYLPTFFHVLNKYCFNASAYSSSEELLELVKSGFLEAAIVQDVKNFKSLKHLFLFEEPYLLAVSSRHPLAKKEFVELRDLHNETIILPPAPNDTYTFIEMVLKNYGIQPKLKIMAPLEETVLSYTSNKIGVTFIPELVASNISMKDTIYKRLKGEPLKRSLYFLSRSSTVLEQFENILQSSCMLRKIECIS